MQWRAVGLAVMASLALAGCRGEVWLLHGHGAHAPVVFVPNQAAFWSPDRGIAVDQGGRRLAVTADGGRTWDVISAWRHRVTSLAVSSGGSVELRGWRSADFGGTWSPSHAIAGTARVWLTATDPQVEWAQVGGGGGERGMRLEHTTDGGVSWSRVRLPCGHRFISAFVSAPTAARAWLVCTGEPGAGSVAVSVHMTENGGTSWSRLPRGRLGSFGYPSGLTMTAGGDGILTMIRGFSWVTHDGGRHWQPLRSITAPDIRQGLSATQISRRRSVMLVYSGDTGTTLYRSDDGDRTWSLVRRWPAR